MKKFFPYIFAVLIMTGCAGMSRDCSNCWASSVGGDFVIVELTEAEGKPYRCWSLKGVAIVNEKNSDGVYWKDPETGNMVHISGSYDYVQVKGGNWEQAYHYLNLTKEACEKVGKKRFNADTNRYE